MTSEPARPAGRGGGGWIALSALAAAHFALHMATNGNYGIFRDEYYYLACANHLAWGYVDHPPLSIALLAGAKALLGDSVNAIRLLPALAGASLIVLAGLLAAELGGGRYARVLAGVCAFIAPSFLVLTGYFSMNAFDLVLVPLEFYVLLRILKTGDSRLWLVFGLIAGLALMNKIGMLVLGLAFAIGLAATRHRRYFADKYLWLGAALAGLIFLPHLIWQASNGWPGPEFISNAKQYKMLGSSPIQYALGQIVEMHPVNAPIWIAGLFYLLLAGRMRRYRILGVVYLAAFAIFAAQKSKVYYMAPIYPVMLAAGACAVEALARRAGLGWAKAAVLALVAASGAVTLPLGVPILKVDDFIRYQARIGLAAPAEERHETAVLPQYYADRFGWKLMVEKVAGVYESLPPEKRASCVIVTDNYGEAGAIDYYGARYGLPRAISGHNSYYLWGPGEGTATTAICVGLSQDDLKAVFEKVAPVAKIGAPYAMPSEANATISLCWGFKMAPEDIWPLAKHYQ
jgi:hypothetical protein